MNLSKLRLSDVFATLAETLPKQQFKRFIQNGMAPVLDELPPKQQNQFWDSLWAGLPAQLQNVELEKTVDVRAAFSSTRTHLLFVDVERSWPFFCLLSIKFNLARTLK